MPVNLTFSALFLAGLHGTSIIKILLILTVNYTIAKLCRGSRLGPLLTWVFNGLVLFANEWYSGYRFGEILPALHLLVRPDPHCNIGASLKSLQDSYQGFYPRWHISFNITMLRLVSFNMDYCWACRTESEPKVGASHAQILRTIHGR